jgi:hypothetical protein
MLDVLQVLLSLCAAEFAREVNPSKMCTPVGEDGLAEPLSTSLRGCRFMLWQPPS